MLPPTSAALMALGYAVGPSSPPMSAALALPTPELRVAGSGTASMCESPRISGGSGARPGVSQSHMKRALDRRESSLTPVPRLVFHHPRRRARYAHPVHVRVRLGTGLTRFSRTRAPALTVELDDGATVDDLFARLRADEPG